MGTFRVELEEKRTDKQTVEDWSIQCHPRADTQPGGRESSFQGLDDTMTGFLELLDQRLDSGPGDAK